MRLFKALLGIVVLLGLLLVLMKNTDPVAVDLLVRKFENVPVAFVILVTVGVGIFIGYVLALSVIMTSKAETRLLRNENKKLSDEINSLRNIAVDEGIYEIDDEEE
ncbi:MAG TPA: LapA family protein [Candidatus Marinimicrobia bacterium]|nr:LapA family protein [Candidatus Neomarinimicrobiota bacterium]